MNARAATRWLAGILFVAFLVGGVTPARAEVTVDLYTMGVGDDAFSKFGHAALCVEPSGGGEGRCYNFGTADFARPVPLALGFLAGRAPFWVSVSGRSRMLSMYRHMDRRVWRQRLPLAPSSALGLASRLASFGGPDAWSYHYRFFHDNCATRLRDLIDEATGGALRAGADARFSTTYRHQVRAAFAGEVELALAGELLLARLGDQPMTTWDAMYLPDVLRDVVARQFGSVPELVIERTAPVSTGPPWRGRAAVLSLGAILAGLAGALVARGGRAWRRVGLGLAGLGLGGLALAPWAIVVIASVPELRWNEVVLVLLPTDLALPFLGRRLRGYLAARAVGLACVALLALVGVLVQPLWAPLAAVGLVVGALLLATRSAS